MKGNRVIPRRFSLKLTLLKILTFQDRRGRARMERLKRLKGVEAIDTTIFRTVIEIDCEESVWGFYF